jgi:hypothetical protein
MSTSAHHRLPDAQTLKAIKDSTGERTRPLLLTGGTVITMNSLLGDWEEADVLIGGSVIVGVGPGLLSAAADDDMIVIDCAGTVVLPSAVDFTAPGSAGTLTPGTTADIAVIRLKDTDGTPAGAVAHRGTHLDIAIAGGRVRTWRGGPVDEDGQAEESPAAGSGESGVHPYLGLWVDEKDFVRQELLPDGRYDEARGDRSSAYEGRYWIDGTRIDYLDDLGFWAFGEFQDDVLLHAGYRFTRR